MKRKDFMLTPNVSYNEMTRSTWAQRNHVSNNPDCLQTAALTNLARTLMEPLRRQFGIVEIRSAFRTQAVNEGMRGVGCSRHLTGEAVDIKFPDQETGRAYYRFILANIDFDQLFFEYDRHGHTWLHCSVCLQAGMNRHQSFPNYRVKV